MKKLLGIVVLSLLLVSNSYAATAQSLIDSKLKNRKLEKIEGVWNGGGFITVIYKDQGNYYLDAIINGSTRCNTRHRLIKISDNLFEYKRNAYKFEIGGKSGDCRLDTKWTFSYTYSVSGNTLTFNGRASGPSNLNPWSQSMARTWPDNFSVHNDKFKTKEDTLEEDKQLAIMVNTAKKTCGVLGFEPGTEKFADCTLKLYTQKVEELIAEKQSKNQVVQNQASSSQSSGSNTTTIYDPVRDSQNLINKGQKMLSGGCTLGVDC